MKKFDAFGNKYCEEMIKKYGAVIIELQKKLEKIREKSS
jgi:hypothetical protein